MMVMNMLWYGFSYLRKVLVQFSVDGLIFLLLLLSCCQVSGEVKSVRDALIQIVLRLRDDSLKDKDGASNHSVAPDSLYASSSGLSLPPVLQSVPPANPLGYEPRNESGSGAGMFSSNGHYKYGSLSVC